MTAPGIEVRPIAAMLGPHHLNEVFFDDVWVTEADVLGPRRRRLEVVQEVLVVRARRHRPLRPLRAPAAAARRSVLGDQWEDAARGAARPVGADARRTAGGPGCSPTGSSPCRATGAVSPADAAAYRIAVTRLDQESAEVLDGHRRRWRRSTATTARRFRRAVEDHWRYAVSATVAVGQHRDAAHPAWPDRSLAASMNIELSDEALEYGRLAHRAPSRPPAATSWSSAAESDPTDAAAARSTPVLDRARRVGARAARERRRAGGRRRAVPQRRATGRSPYPVAERLARPADLDVDGLWSSWPTCVRSAPLAGTRSALGRGDARRSPQPGHRLDRRPSRRGSRRSSPTLDLEPLDGAGAAADVALGSGAAVLDVAGHAGPGDRAHLRATCSSASSSDSHWRRSRASSSSSPTPRSSAAGVEELAKYALWSVPSRHARGARRRAGAAAGGDRGGRHRVPGRPPAARRDRVL